MTITPLPDFLKHGHPDLGLPAPRPRPGTMHFPEAPPPRAPWGHEHASTGEWAQREWERLVDAGVIGRCEV